MPVPPTPAHERVLRRTQGRGDCWLFTGAKNERGYGVVQLGRGIGTDKAHRVVYAALVGPIPDGATLDHLCHTPTCVNPAHLEPVTRRENTLRQWRDGNGNAGAANRAKTHCPRGHPYDEENTHVNGAGKRVCRACARERARRQRSG